MKARRARGRQHMVGAADIIADHFRRMGADENGAGIADAFRPALRHHRWRFRDVRRRCGWPAAARHPSPAPGSPRRNQPSSARGLGAVERRRVGARRLPPPRRQRPRRGCHQDRLRTDVVFGLGQQVGGDPVGIVVGSAITRTSDGPAIMSMPTVPKTWRLAAATQALPGPDNLGDGLDGFGAIGKGGDCLGAADAVDLGDTGNRAAASTTGLSAPSRAGTTMTIRSTPATLAAPRSSAPNSGSWRCRRAHRGRRPRSPSSASQARRQALSRRIPPGRLGRPRLPA
jgi:hypothetical protein